MIVTNLQRPSEEQMKMFMEFPDDAPIKMVNLLKFKIKAEYADGRSTDLSGKEAYAIYAQEVQEHLKKVGAKLCSYFFKMLLYFLSINCIRFFT